MAIIRRPDGKKRRSALSQCVASFARSRNCFMVGMMAIVVSFALFGKDLFVQPTFVLSDDAAAVRAEYSYAEHPMQPAPIDTARPEGDSVQSSQVGSAAPKSIPTNEDGKVVVYFSPGRGDRSGATIQDILLCHAFVFRRGDGVYAGICPTGAPGWERNKHKHAELLQAIGLDRIVSVTCPRDIKENRTHIHSLDDVPLAMPLQPKLLKTEMYKSDDTRMWTPQYMKYIQSQIRYARPQQFGDEASGPLVAVHIRRGDIVPCRPKTRGYDRYLPNSHYLRLIQEYLPSLNDQKGAQQQPRVVVFSESQSFENFTDFTDRGYEVVLDGDIGLVWQTMVVADLLIMSRSSFSLVPGLLSRAKTVVFTPMWHQPLASWEVVPPHLMDQSMAELKRMQDTKCLPGSLKVKKKGGAKRTKQT